MRSTASGSLSEAADALPSGSERGIGDASFSTDDDSDAEVADVRMCLATPDDTVGAESRQQTHGSCYGPAQRTRSWDDSVEEGMAKIDADAAADDTAGTKG